MVVRYSKSTDGVNWKNLKHDLAKDHFDNGRTPRELKQSFENSAVVAFAFDKERVIGKGRAISDGVCNAYVVDVWTHSDYRRQGIASHIMNSILAGMTRKRAHDWILNLINHQFFLTAVPY